MVMFSHVTYGQGTNIPSRSIVYFPGAASVALFSELLIDPLRPNTESDISMLHDVVLSFPKLHLKNKTHT